MRRVFMRPVPVRASPAPGATSGGDGSTTGRASQGWPIAPRVGRCLGLCSREISLNRGHGRGPCEGLVLRVADSRRGRLPALLEPTLNVAHVVADVTPQSYTRRSIAHVAPATDRRKRDVKL